MADTIQSLEQAPITAELRSDLTHELRRVRYDMHREYAAILDSTAKVTEGVAGAALAAMAADELRKAGQYAP